MEEASLQEASLCRASFASVASRHLEAAPSTPPTPATPLPEEHEGCCAPDPSTHFFPTSGQLPAYRVARADLAAGSVWDSHCHLDFLARRMARVGIRHGHSLAASLQQDGEALGELFGGCVANFCDPRDWTAGSGGFDLSPLLVDCRKQERVHLTLGCHPHFAGRLGGQQKAVLKRLVKQKWVVAIGECGLDRSPKNDIPMEVQRKAFAYQLQLAVDLKLPLVLHIREAEEEAREVMREVGVAANHRIHRHCFTGSWEVADSWLQAYPGSKLGLTALVTFPHAREVQEVARRVPLCRLLLETDAPYFLPRQVSQGAAYTHSFAMPGHVVHVAAQVAALRDLPVDEVLRANRRNIAEVYGINTVS